LNPILPLNGCPEIIGVKRIEMESLLCGTNKSLQRIAATAIDYCMLLKAPNF
jgi:hypothetical protein